MCNELSVGLVVLCPGFIIEVGVRVVMVTTDDLLVDGDISGLVVDFFENVVVVFGDVASVIAVVVVVGLGLTGKTVAGAGAGVVEISSSLAISLTVVVVVVLAKSLRSVWTSEPFTQVIFTSLRTRICLETKIMHLNVNSFEKYASLSSKAPLLFTRV